MKSQTDTSLYIFVCGEKFLDKLSIKISFSSIYSVSQNFLNDLTLHSKKNDKTPCRGLFSRDQIWVSHLGRYASSHIEIAFILWPGIFMDSHESNLESSSYTIYIWFWRNHTLCSNLDLSPSLCILWSFRINPCNVKWC